MRRRRVLWVVPAMDPGTDLCYPGSVRGASVDAWQMISRPRSNKVDLNLLLLVIPAVAEMTEVLTISAAQRTSELRSVARPYSEGADVQLAPINHCPGNIPDFGQ